MFHFANITLYENYDCYEIDCYRHHIIVNFIMHFFYKKCTSFNLFYILLHLKNV
jgi:hypothetical protein